MVIGSVVSEILGGGTPPDVSKLSKIADAINRSRLMTHARSDN